MFDITDHIVGAIKVRIKRKLNELIRKPDVSTINNYFAIGGHTNIELLSKNNFKAILDLRKESKDDKEQLKQYKISYLRIPINDRKIPTKIQSELGIRWIKENIENDKRVFIHCNLGRGRAPLFAILYLISTGWDYTEAIKEIKKKRSSIFFNQLQLEYIKKFQAS